jgi:hypothetical protein
MSDDIARDELVVEKPAPEDERLWGVTTLLKVARGTGPGLEYWGKEQVAKAALKGQSTVAAMLREQGEAAALKWLMDAPYRRPKDSTYTNAERGTAVHRACETYAKTGERPEVDDEVAPYLNQFEKWLVRFQPVTYEAAEMTVYSRRYSYAGTCDAFMWIDGHLFIVDYKTAAKSYDAKGNPTTPYPEAVLQLAAYAHAEFAAAWRVRRFEQFYRRYYLLGEDELDAKVEIPKAEAGLVIHIAPEHCEAYPVPVDDDMFNAFLDHLEVARFTLDTSKDFFREPLVAPS